MAVPKPKKAASIEDLFKPTSAAPLATPSSVTQKTKKVQTKTSSEMTSEDRLEFKMADIQHREIERLAEEGAKKQGLDYINLKGFPITPEALSILPREEAEAFQAITFYVDENQLRIGVTHINEKMKALADRLAQQRHLVVSLALISSESLAAALKLYDALPQTKEVLYGVRINAESLETYAKEIGDLQKLQETILKVSTTDLVALMIGAAMKIDASDIHVEAEEKTIKIRFRIDGDLTDAATLPKSQWHVVISRLKLLAGVKMNVEEVPQDGRITIYLPSEKLEIRVSFLPTAFGESVVMRLLRPRSIALEFDQLGIRGTSLERLQREIERPNGMIVTTGPTGSGKTTTLYAVLKKLNTPDIKIITLEEPVEYKLPGINQSQVDYSKDYTFAKGLRSILRQDPDVVMVGEIRDLETAEIAIQAALTGHLVISTIHTNSAAGAIPRFLSMGAKPFLLAPAINCIIGQRLIKKIHPDAKIPVEIAPDVLERIKTELARIPAAALKDYHVDLNHLQFYGPKPDAPQPYKGRVGIYEIFTMTKEIEQKILSGNVSEFDMLEIAEKQGMITMAQDGLLKALEGTTTVEEVLRAAELNVS